jgi:hypothetical protein
MNANGSFSCADIRVYARAGKFTARPKKSKKPMKEGKNENVCNVFGLFGFAVNIPRNGMRVNPRNPRTFAKLIGDKMMKKRVLVGLCAVMTVIAGCEDAGSGGSGNEPGPGGGAVAEVGLNLSSLVLGVDKSADLTALVSPANAANKTVIWKSDNEHVATVENGVVTGVAEGTAAVAVTTVTGGKTATCKVTVVFAVVASEKDWTDALAAISNTAGGNAGNPRVFEIHITENFEAKGKIDGSTVAGEHKKVRLTGKKAVKLSGAGSLIRTAAGQTFVIDGPKLKGASNSYPLVYIDSNSAVELVNGTIQDNFNITPYSSKFGGGVHVNGGTFTMEAGGTVSRNTAANNGAGVYVHGGTFTMKAGAAITENKAVGWGGGVYVRNAGTFTMENGNITNNAAGYRGGGVLITDGTFTMEAGTISGNEGHFLIGSATDPGGGGVNVTGGTFTMKGGTISGNTATNNGGGGVHVHSGGTFQMKGGDIIGNSSSNGGGGVQVVNGPDFTMENGTIKGNASKNGKNGVHVEGKEDYTKGSAVKDEDVQKD